MTDLSLPAAVERLEGVAAEALEELIEDLEAKQHVQVEKVDVALVPDSAGDSPTVVVVVSTKSKTE